MGCSSSSVQAQKAQAKRQPEAPLTIIEATPQERALLQFRLVFDSIDADENGAASKEGLTKALEKDPSLGSLVKEAGFNVKYDVLGALDTNTDGCVSWQEFQGHLMEEAVEEVKDTRELVAVKVPTPPPPPTHSVDASPVLKQLKAIFASIDVNKNGTVSKDELVAKLTDEHGLLKDGSFGQLVEEAGFNSGFHLFDGLDTTEDGRITWDEFEANLRKAAPAEVKEQGDIVVAVELQETDDGVAPLCGCW